MAGLPAVFFFSAMHCLKSGASGTEAFGAVVALGFCWPAEATAAIFIQWSKVLVLMVWSPTLATASPGTPPPHADSDRASTKKAQSARTNDFMVM